jgi:hypothetical protein
MSLMTAATLVTWIRSEMGGQVFADENPAMRGYYFIRIEAPRLKGNARCRIEAALHKNGEDVVLLLTNEEPEGPPHHPAGAAFINWAAQARRHL